MSHPRTISPWWPLTALLFMTVACGDSDHSTSATESAYSTAEDTSPDPTTTASLPPATPPSSTELPATSSSSEPQSPPPSSVTVTDPTGDVVVTDHFGDVPAYDPRADLVAYTLSWSDVVTFSLTTVEVDAAMLDDVWLAFDTDDDSSGFPELAVFNIAGTNALYELRDQWVFVCPVRRSIVEESYVVEFDAGCLDPWTELRLRSPYQWFYSVGEPPTGAPNYCGVPDITVPGCKPFANYTDEMPGAGPIMRSP